MKKALATMAIILLALIASPFLLFGVLLVLGGALFVVTTGIGLIAFVVTWLIPIVIVLAALGGIWYLVSLLSDKLGL